MKKEILENRKAVIFDLDGTLLDSMGIWRKIDEDFLGKRGFEVPDDYQAAITPMSTYETAVYTIQRFHLQEEPEDLIREWMDMAYHAYRYELELKPFAYEYIQKLDREGVQMGIASSSENMLVEAAVDKNGLSGYIKTIVTSTDVNKGKGFPDVYLKCAEKLDVKAEECLVFEDIIEGIRGAGKGGFFTVGVEEAANASMKAELEAEADFFIHSFRELL